jgi:hypothetical protein
VNGEPRHHPDGVFFRRYALEGKRLKHVGKDWQLALDAQLKQDRAMAAAQAVGVEVVQETGKRRLSDAIVEYNAETKKQKAKRTHAAYRLTLALFQSAIKMTYQEDISREDLLTSSRRGGK